MMLIPLLVLTGTDIVAAISAFLVLLGVLATTVLAFFSNRSTSAVAIAGQLASRVTKLENDLAVTTTKHAGELDEIRGQLTLSQRATVAAVRFIDRLVEWGKAGGHPDRMPTPPKELHEFLDPELWESGR